MYMYLKSNRLLKSMYMMIRGKIKKCMFFIWFISQLCFCLICVQLKTIARKVRYQLYVTSAEIILSPEQLWTSAKVRNTGRMTDLGNIHTLHNQPKQGSGNLRNGWIDYFFPSNWKPKSFFFKVTAYISVEEESTSE